MKNGKSCGLDGVPTEVLKHLGDWGVCQITNVFNTIMQGGKMPDECREKTITPIYKGMNCSNYRGIKLLRHNVKVSWTNQMLKDIMSISDGRGDEDASRDHRSVETGSRAKRRH